jgi:hypothetical protein
MENFFAPKDPTDPTDLAATNEQKFVKNYKTELKLPT